MKRPQQAQDLPHWTRGLLAAGGVCPSRRPWRAVDDQIERRDAEGSGYRLLSYRVRDAVELGAADFERVCSQIYRKMAVDLPGGGHGNGNGAAGNGTAHEARHPIRLWNFIPHILSPLGSLEHRYMVFNAGRFDALSAWLGGEGGIDRGVATASGVGHFGRDLEIHCLASDVAGEPVENPRQISAYRYSKRYGPKPPCFARATRFQPTDDAPWLLVGGTASVVGEDSQHRTCLDRQLHETLCNLAAVVHASGVECGDPDLAGDELVAVLMARYRHLRVYYVREQDRDVLAAELASRLGPGAELELVHADLCRPELLVEIEGVADLAESRDRRGIDALARLAVG